MIRSVAEWREIIKSVDDNKRLAEYFASEVRSMMVKFYDQDVDNLANLLEAVQDDAFEECKELELVERVKNG